jgi:hypothetical protein
MRMRRTYRRTICAICVDVDRPSLSQPSALPEVTGQKLADTFSLLISTYQPLLLPSVLILIRVKI